MLWKMSLMCGLKKQTKIAVYTSSYGSWAVPDRSGFHISRLWCITVWETSPGLLVSSWHEGGSITCPFFSATDSAANEQQPFLFQTLTAPLNDRNTGAENGLCSVRSAVQKRFSVTYCCISVLRVATVDDDVPGLEQRNLKDDTRSTDRPGRKAGLIHKGFQCSRGRRAYQFINEVVHGLAGFDQQDDPPGLLQLGHHVLQRFGSDHFGTLRLILQEVVHLGHGSIVGTDLQREDCWLLRGKAELPGAVHRSWPYHKAMVIHVHDEVLAHDSQTNQCDVCSVERTGEFTASVPWSIELQSEQGNRNSPPFPPLLTFRL